jgi:hypothetical protein
VTGGVIVRRSHLRMADALPVKKQGNDADEKVEQPA